MGKRFFHFSYPAPQKQRRPRLHALRDGDAFAELAAALYEQRKGYEYGGLVLNFPGAEPPNFGPSDLLVLTTRPPLNDDSFDRRYIPRSGTGLEQSILKAAGHYFSFCRRSLVMLSEGMAAELGPDSLDRGEIEFTMYGGAYYKRHRRPYTRSRELHKWVNIKKPTEAAMTAGFVLMTRLWDDGPSLLNAFGINGAGTLIWCHLLRTAYPHLLRSPRFVMAEIIAPPAPERPPTLAFANDWRIEVLLNHPLK